MKGVGLIWVDMQNKVVLQELVKFRSINFMIKMSGLK